ncbi:MAG: hypothetical protein EA349_13295 [Halomonadaceae bacterium]|nr:MAG: hypothetical protein EA349_13295 [Halomonadaceae bacterium]
MSYILDALRKSEQERNQSRVVDQPGSAPMMYRRQGRRQWPLWLLPLLLLNLAVLGYLFWHNGYNGTGVETGSGDINPVTQQPVDQRLLEQTRSLEEIANRPASAEREAEPFRVPEPLFNPQLIDQGVAAETPDAHFEQGFRTGQTLPGSVPEASPEAPRSAASRATRPRDDPVAREGVPLLIDKPEAFRRRVPDLVFNSHVYSTSPGSRRVIINQQYLAEGDRVGPLRLLEITPGGVILSLDNTPFAVAVVHNWVQPR